jgi:hypothetical protein
MPKGRRDVRSHPIGLAVLDDGRTTTVYRAVERLTCADCIRPILPDALFSRCTQRASMLTARQTRVAVCAVCRPLHLEGPMTAPSPAGEEEGR